MMKIFGAAFMIVAFQLLFPFEGLHAQSQQQLITVQGYILKYRELAIQKMKTYKIPASIILGQGLLESANGNSELALNANNHFGIKCHKDWKGESYLKDDDQKGECFRKYKTVDESYEDHSRFIAGKDRYARLFLLDPMDYKAWAKGLKEAGYATNPDYARLLVKVIEDNKLYELDQGILSVLSNPQAKGKTGKAGSDAFGPITIGGPGREVMMNNGLEFTFARPGDDFDKLSNALNVSSGQLRRYNDISRDHKFAAGEIVYITGKRRKAQTDYHVVVKGERMWDISQRYGLKIKVLYRRNHMEPGSEPRTGDKLWLNKSKP